MKHRRNTLFGAVLALTLLLSACSPASGGAASSAPSSAAAQSSSQAPSSASSQAQSSVQSSSQGAYHKISAEDGKKLMDMGGVTVVDVRRADEYSAGHIPGAINVPNEGIADTKPARLHDLSAKLIIYCRTGVRSKQASDKLVKMGYQDVNDMGGIVDWHYDTVTGSEPGKYAAAAAAAKKASDGILGSFTATDLDGNTVDQSLFDGYRLTMVNVWATYCSPCIGEMPELGALASEYASKGVRIVGIVSDTLNSKGSVSESQVKTAKSIVEKTGAAYTHIVPSQDLFGLISQVTAVPTTFFVDSVGRQVGSAYLGAKDKAKWAAVIDNTLSEAMM